MNRNILTASDLSAFAAAAEPAEVPKSMQADPPAGAVPPAGGPQPPVPTQDDFLTKLLKFVPLEILGVYLFVAGVVDSNVDGADARATWLLVVTVVLAIAIVPYDLRVLGVVRGAQVAMSVLGFGVYVFALGGWFATTTWYEPWHATIALPVFTLLIGLLKLKPLPPSGS